MDLAKAARRRHRFNRSRRVSPDRIHLSFEVLEDRSLLSVSPLASAATPDFAIYHPPLASAVKPDYVIYHANGPYASSGSSSPSGYTPAQIETAYGINAITDGGVAQQGAGETIAIVDAYDDPNMVSSSAANFATSDLHQFDLMYHLPESAGFFTKVNQTGGTSYPTPATPDPVNGSWATEISLDVEWAHSLAPMAKIILVEATDDSNANLAAAVQWAGQSSSAQVVSMSFGGNEFDGETSLDSGMVSPAGYGVTYLAATGDAGAPSGYPAYSPNVVAVGGTSLYLSGLGGYGSETGWSGSAGGISQYEPSPSYQQGLLIHNGTSVISANGYRANPDVSFDADPNTGVPIYDSYDFGSATPWLQIGGTSFACPAWASLVAITDEIRANHGLPSLDGPSQTLPYLYNLYATKPGDFNDVTTGSSSGSPTYSAGPGYDLVTGIGTPKANLLVSDLANLPLMVTSSTPANGAVVSTPPTSFVIQFSEAVSAASLQASDLTVNSIAANSVTLSSDGLTASFTYTTSPVTTAGPQTMAVAAGAVAKQDALGTNTAFAATFTYAPVAGATTTAITSDHPSGSVYGQLVTFTATVSELSGSAVPTGSVQFAIDGSNYGSSVVLVSGTAGIQLGTLSAATHAITATYTPDSSDFDSSNLTVSFVVRAAPLTVAADNQSRTYGAANPPLTATVTGFVNGDNLASLPVQPALATAATVASPVGRYAITVSGPALDGNYSVTYVSGTLTVAPASLTLTANDQSRPYDTVNPPLTVTATGFINGDTLASLSAKPVLATTAATTSPPGAYPITITGPALDGNYAVTYVNGTLTVFVLPPTISNVAAGTTSAHVPVLTAQVSDVTGITSTTMTVDGISLLIAGPYGTRYSGTYDGLLGALPGGYHNYVITATNAFGVTATAAGGFTTSSPSAGGPTISSIVVAASASTPVITWRLTDGAGVRITTISVDGTYLPVYGPYGTKYAGNYAGVMGALSAGSHSYIITAIDARGASSQASGAFLVASPSLVSAAGPVPHTAISPTTSQPARAPASIIPSATTSAARAASLSVNNVQLAAQPSGGLVGQSGNATPANGNAAATGSTPAPTPVAVAGSAHQISPNPTPAANTVSAANRVELLASVLHEMGPASGYRDESAANMIGAALSAGARRTLALDRFFAAFAHG